MNSKSRDNRSPRVLLIILTFICVALIGISCLFHDGVKPFTNIFAKIVVPMQNGINDTGAWIGSHFGSFKSSSELRAENKVLKERLEALTEQNELYKSKLKDLDDLKDLVKMDEEFFAYETISARVISSGSGNWYSEFIINKGSDDGIKENMNVVSSDGLIGLITEVGHNYAKVRSIIDDDSNVSAISEKTSDTCIVKGNREKIASKGYIDVSYIGQNAKIKNGEMLITSHISSKYLQGLKIGTISEIKTDSSNLTKSAVVTPSVDFQHIKQVLVITQMKEVPQGVETAD